MSEVPLLSVRDLRAVIDTRAGATTILNGVSFDVWPEEAVGVVGESGSGKTMTALSVLGLLPSQARITSGRVLFDGRDLVTATEEARRAVRGSQIAMIFQDPMTSLNPLQRVGEQIAEGMLVHGVEEHEADERALEVLAQVGIPDPQRAARAYPHEFSGGMRQRVMIASVIAMSPKLLIADEATSALDVTIQQQILALVRRLQHENHMAVLWITHDMGVVARLVDRVLVMYAGHLVEQGAVRPIFSGPEHPYTAALLDSIPSLEDRSRAPLAQIAGAPPDPAEAPPGCPFEPRCPQSIERCITEMPGMTPRKHGGSAACWVPPEEWSTACSA
ncbi:MAG: ABC transporter ATP-binding protein [Actinomycetota bacterium]